jgi:NADH-quinone oxidoreductase subunit M
MGLVREHLLTLMIFVPAIGALLLLFVPSRRAGLVKAVAVVSTLIPLMLACFLWTWFRRDTAEPQFVTQVGWIDKFNIEYYVGVDGISVSLVILTALISFLGIFASWNIEHWSVSRGIQGYFALYLLLEAGMMGVFCALDFFLFYVFWEVMLLPMFFLIGVWGGPRREYAAIKFFLYTLVGSVLMLVVLLAFYFMSDADPNLEGAQHTFNLITLARPGVLPLGADVGWWRLAFVALFIGFAIKIPSFPFHTWLPDAHVEAPTPISVILASVLLKMGIYGILRVSYPILPEAALWFAPMMMLLGTISIIYGGLCAMAQIRGVPRINRATGERYVERDWKKLIAYSSVSHMGFCMIGMASFTPAGLNGALFQCWNHGIITGMLFLLIGVIYDRAHHRDVDGFGGLMTPMPRYAGFTALAFMASLGLPGLAGFISEVLCFIGAFQAVGPAGQTHFAIPAEHYYRILTALSVGGVVIGAAYFLWSYQKVFLGPIREKYANLPDMDLREFFTLAPLAAITVLLGLYPAPILGLLERSVDLLVTHMGAAGGVPWLRP